MRDPFRKSKALNALRDIAHRNHAHDASEALRERLEHLVREMSAPGLTHQDIIRAVMGWAAEQSYAGGGYPHARSLMLDTLEDVLLLDMMKKNAA